MCETVSCPSCGNFLVDKEGYCWYVNTLQNKLCYFCDGLIPFSIWSKIPVDAVPGYSVGMVEHFKEKSNV